MDSPERPTRTQKFQVINDAYYVLSDHSRRSDYDRIHKPEKESTGDGKESQAHTPGGGPDASEFAAGSERASQQFGSVFEEMLREEGLAREETGRHGRRHARPTSRFWSVVGGVSGGALGFIVGNFPGAMAGAVAGNRLGAVRDAKGKSVYEVFLDLPQQDRARLLAELANKVFQTALGH